MDENAVSISNIPNEVAQTDGNESKLSDKTNDEDITNTADGLEEVTEEHTENNDQTKQYGKEKVVEEQENEEKSTHDGELVTDEELGAEKTEGEQVEKPEKTEEQQPAEIEQVEEEDEGYVEEPPPDPTAPLDFSESKEILKPPFVLRPDQIAEVEQLWEFYQNYTPAYTDIDGYITEKELVYMLKALLLMTYTAEQLQELIAFCVRPPHPQGHINYNQFLKMVTLRQRDFPIEDELRSALQVFDPGRTGSINREYLKEVLAKQGHKMPQKQLDNLIKEVDISNDGTIGIEDVVGTMCIDLNKDDILMLMASLNSPDEITSKQS